MDSEEVGGEAVNAFDGNPRTIWHTEWKKKSPRPPHEIQIDLGQTHNINGFRYLPRQDGSSDGRIRLFEIYVSNDGQTWNGPVATGSFPNSRSEKEILFNATPGRYFRLRALSEVKGNPWITVAEINVLSFQ